MSTHLQFNLDSGSPVATMADSSGNLFNYFERYTFTLAPHEQHTFEIIAATNRWTITWKLDIEFLINNRIANETIENNGQPFKVTAELAPRSSSDQFGRYRAAYGECYGYGGQPWPTACSHATANSLWVEVPSPASSPSPSPSPYISGQGKAALSYSKYTNPRYGFTTLWPASFTTQPSPADGDGQAWTSPDGRVLLSAYGTKNVLNYSPQQDELADSRGLSVVYRNISGNVVIVSGHKNSGHTIVYQRDVVGHGAIDTLYWSYPAGQKTPWDAAVALTARAFRPGDVATGH